MVEIRRATEKDFEPYFKLYKEFAVYDKKINPRYFHRHLAWDKNAKKIIKKNFLRNIRRIVYRVFVAADNGKIIGFVEGSIFKRSRYYKLKKTGFIEELFITKKYRGKGISSKLRDKLFDWFKSKGVTDFSLNVYYANKPTINIYKKWKFKPYAIFMFKKVKK